MNSNFKFKIENSSAGITLVEIIVVMVIIVLFATILIADFPAIMKQFALSRASYKLAEDLRRAQDLGLSGVQLNDKWGNPILVYGYGIYVNLSQSQEQYIIYADVGVRDQIYDPISPVYCDQVDQMSNGQLHSDCIVDSIDVSNTNPDLYIKPLSYINGDTTSINFRPPGPTIDISNFILNPDSKVGINLGLKSDSSSTRTVWINKAGLIEVQ